MKYAVRKHPTMGIYQNYNNIMYFFVKQFFGSDDIDDGRDFIYTFGDYIEESDFPCDKICLDCFTGYSDRFYLDLYYKDNKIAHILLQVKKYDIIKIYSYTYEKKDFSIFHDIIADYFDNRNGKILGYWKKICHIKDNCNTIEIENYVDYKITEVTKLTGTLEEIFENYTTINDKLKYCNGHYVKFKNKDIQTLYYLFTDLYKGNYFLDNAVKRGVIID